MSEREAAPADAVCQRVVGRRRTDPLCANTLDILLYVCDACHEWIHSHPDECDGDHLGLLLRSWDKGNGYVPISHGTIPRSDAEVGYDLPQ